MAESPPTIAGRLVILPDDVGADDIISPDYLAFDLDDPEQRKILARYALLDVLDGQAPLVPLDPGAAPDASTLLFAGRNFGHSSARPHAPVALAAAGVKVVVARSFSSQFIRTAVNLGCFHCLTPLDPAVPTPPPAEVAWLKWTTPTPHLAAPGSHIALADPGVSRLIVEHGGLLPHLARSRSDLP